MKQLQASRPVVLVIDDKPAMRTLIRETLEAAGMTIFETNVGSAAVTLFEQHSPDLVLLDIVMPDMKGLETCSRIRSLPRGNRVPVLIMTEHGDAESIAIAYEHGATDFITKPINPMILLHRTRYMLRAKNVLEALIKSEARLELAQRIARIGNWDWEPRTNRFTMSNELCRLVGVRPQDFGGTIDDFLALVHPDDRASVKQALADIPNHHRPCDMDHRVVLQNGLDFTIHLQGEGVRDEQTHEFKVVGTAQDITERKQAERAIHRLAYYDSLTGLATRFLF